MRICFILILFLQTYDTPCGWVSWIYVILAFRYGTVSFTHPTSNRLFPHQAAGRGSVDVRLPHTTPALVTEVHTVRLSPSSIQPFVSIRTGKPAVMFIENLQGTALVRV